MKREDHGMNGYRVRLLRADEPLTALRCDECERDAAMLLWSVELRPSHVTLCAEHMVERACGWGLGVLDEVKGPHEMQGAKP